eukprot:7216013-Lingulodinium_polyedra.AAC.1
MHPAVRTDVARGRTANAVRKRRATALNRLADTRHGVLRPLQQTIRTAILKLARLNSENGTPGLPAPALGPPQTMGSVRSSRRLA